MYIDTIQGHIVILFKFLCRISPFCNTKWRDLAKELRIRHLQYKTLREHCKLEIQMMERGMKERGKQ
jgi:hypothetical protein